MCFPVFELGSHDYYVNAIIMLQQRQDDKIILTWVLFSAANLFVCTIAICKQKILSRQY
jgi:hypothetical protein